MINKELMVIFLNGLFNVVWACGEEIPADTGRNVRGVSNKMSRGVQRNSADYVLLSVGRP